MSEQDVCLTPSLRFPPFFYQQRLNTAAVPFLISVTACLLFPSALYAVLFCLAAVSFSLWMLLAPKEKRTGLFFVLLGLSLSLFCAVRLAREEQLVARFDERVAVVSGVVISSGFDGYELLATELDSEASFVSVYVESEHSSCEGDRLTVRLLLQKMRDRTMRAEGILLSAREESERVHRGSNGLLRFVSDLRERILEAFGEGEEADFYRAILLGDRSGLTSSVTDAFSDTASAHLLAISGLHLSQMVSGFFFLFRLIGLPKRARMLFFFPLVLFIILLTGASPSVLRAGLMVSFALSARLSRRRVSSLTSLCLAASLIVFCQPHVLFSPSFLFSFVSTLAIVTVCVPIFDWALGRVTRSATAAARLGKKLLFSLLFPFASAAAVFVFTAPLALLFFDRILPSAVIASVLLLPLFSPCVILGLLFSVPAAFGMLILPLRTVALWYAKGFVFLASFLAKSTQLDLSFGPLALPLAVLFAAALFYCIAARKRLSSVFFLFAAELLFGLFFFLLT